MAMAPHEHHHDKTKDQHDLPGIHVGRFRAVIILRTVARLNADDVTLRYGAEGSFGEADNSVTFTYTLDRPLRLGVWQKRG